jgi:hypothetical protein
LIALLALGAGRGLNAQRLRPSMFPSAAPTFAAAPSARSSAARLFYDESAAALSRRGATTGALIGLGVGVVVGFLTWRIVEGPCEPDGCRTLFIAAGAVSGVVIGGVIGALTGSKHE